MNKEERGVREDNSEGMSMEQAIYELKKHKKNTHYILLHKEVDDIIKLLQQGEINQSEGMNTKMKDSAYTERTAIESLDYFGDWFYIEIPDRKVYLDMIKRINQIKGVIGKKWVK